MSRALSRRDLEGCVAAITDLGSRYDSDGDDDAYYSDGGVDYGGGWGGGRGGEESIRCSPELHRAVGRELQPLHKRFLGACKAGAEVQAQPPA